MILKAISEEALMLTVGEDISDETAQRVQSAVHAIENSLGDDVIDLIPSYTSVLIVFDPLKNTHLLISRRIRSALSQHDLDKPLSERSTVVLPVYYSLESGADLETLAKAAALTPEAVIDLHCAQEYRVYAIGFAPGFAYMGQVDERIATPRLATPRTSVPSGSVAIAERQTAVYPARSPGGWNLIGRCPVPMFNRQRDPHMPVTVGDSVRFEPISRTRYLELGGALS